MTWRLLIPLSLICLFFGFVAAAVGVAEQNYRSSIDYPIVASPFTERVLTIDASVDDLGEILRVAPDGTVVRVPSGSYAWGTTSGVDHGVDHGGGYVVRGPGGFNGKFHICGPVIGSVPGSAPENFEVYVPSNDWTKKYCFDDADGHRHAPPCVPPRDGTIRTGSRLLVEGKSCSCRKPIPTIVGKACRVGEGPWFPARDDGECHAEDEFKERPSDE